jgi:hypothetical protein
LFKHLLSELCEGDSKDGGVIAFTQGVEKTQNSGSGWISMEACYNGANSLYKESFSGRRTVGKVESP